MRNEFGFTNGGPVVLPGIYDGRDRTFYFGEYQGFRQVLGTTQVIPVPTAAERQGIDTRPSPAIRSRARERCNRTRAHTLSFAQRSDRTFRRPHLCDLIQSRTRAPISSPFASTTASPTKPTADAFQPEPGHGARSRIRIRPPSIPSFGVQFFDHQRNAGVKYARTISPHLTSETSIGYIRSTPFFPAANHTQPGITFGDGLFQPYNSAGRLDLRIVQQPLSVQARHEPGCTHSHAFKWGVEIRVNRDSTIFGTNTNGLYDFGGGTAYSPVQIPSASGTHDIEAGDPLPDSLTGL